MMRQMQYLWAHLHISPSPFTQLRDSAFPIFPCFGCSSSGPGNLYKSKTSDPPQTSVHSKSLPFKVWRRKPVFGIWKAEFGNDL